MVAWAPLIVLGVGSAAEALRDASTAGYACMPVVHLNVTLFRLLTGCTGFGGAIINLLVWVVFDSLGVNAGTLQQAVVTECVSSVFTAPLQLYMAQAWRTADWHITVALLTFTSLGAPVGAALLKFMEPRAVEGIMGVILLVVIALHIDLPAAIAARLSGRQAAPADLDDDGCQASSEMQPLQRTDWGADGKQDDGVEVDMPPDAAISQRSSGISAGGDFAGVAAADLRPLSMTRQRSAGSSAVGDFEGGAATDLRALHVTRHSSTLEKAERQGLQQASGRGQMGRLRACWHAMFDPGGLRLLGMSSIAGCVSGVMGGLTGMGGPPTMLMFVALRVPKDTVRGCQAWINSLQFRVVAYALLGEFAAADMPIYGVACAAALSGLALGDWWSRRVNQAAFSQLLVALMVLCAALMLGSAAGLGLRPHQGHGGRTR